MTAADPIRDAFRRWGYLQADLDPFGRLQPLAHPEIEAAVASDPEAAARWRRVYCGPTGAEFMHVPLAERSAWVAERMEREPDALDHRFILRRLAGAELFERFMHQRYVGTKRYSLEGCAALIPLMDTLLEAAAGSSAGIVLIGMSHRGRLNTMVNVVGVPARELFAHFEDGDPRSVLGGGDVRYHLGATGDYVTRSGRRLHLHLVSNPSHLEAVDPVLMGRARARQDRIGGDAAADQVVPVLVHGDAAFAGQGIAAETLNLDGVPGFGVGGTIHVVVNNLIGFTTPPRSLHGSRHASDVARRLAIPILHVNASRPEAAAHAGRMALEYRARFHTDVVVDLIGFRRYGHSEVDDPTITQPGLYRAIEKTPMLWQTYGEHIGAAAAELETLERDITEGLSKAHEEARGARKVPVFRTLPEYWKPYAGGAWEAALEVDTAVAAERLAEIAGVITATPDGFDVHPKVAKGLELRRAMGRGEKDVDWGMAEALALGTLLRDGIRVRLTGEDTRRGTFSHRHAVLVDVGTEKEYVPLSQVGPAAFSLHDSTLSEAAVLGFEYGYSRDTPDALVCWEAQFGDFANGAQVIIDQFLAAGEDKWGLLSGLVMLLPHGYEGQGPEHSSARLERYLQLSAEDNLQVCQPTTAAQYFHLLRRQALQKWRKPLIVMTPKGLLRAPAAGSPLSALAEGRFEPVIGEEPGRAAAAIRRVIVATGKIVHELRAERAARGAGFAALISLEQLYPFPENEVAAALAAHADADEIVWVQEEPANMGAETFVRPRLEPLTGGRHVTAVHRSQSASPATGSAAAHRLEQQALISLALREPA